MSHGTDDPTGIVVYPKLDVPKGRRSEPRIAGPARERGRGKGPWFAALALALFGGAILGFMFAPPSHEADAAKAKTATLAAERATGVEKDRADGLQKALDGSKKAKADAEAKVAALSTRAADVAKKADELAAQEQKLQATIDKSQGSVDTEGDEIHLRLVDKVLFAVGDDQLTDKGKAVLDKVAVALADLPDKQVWVQGHTDDQPIVVSPAKRDPKKPKSKVLVPAPVRFITNWELSAARALQVVHYLQDVAKIDPARLAALAFGQYRPVSRSNRAANRRIEIVLYPKRAVFEPAKK
jgi:chemotaxis protein MotB